MVAFNKAQMPDTIVTLEQVNAWSGIILSELFPALTAVEETATASRVVQSAPFLVTATNPPTWRLVNRTSFALNAQWRRAGKVWLLVGEFGNTAIPTEYTTP